MLDTKIINGHVIDGTGADAQRADVGIAGDCVAAMGRLTETPAGRVIDAAGCVVCPGFIDVHTHSDLYLLIEPSSPSKLHQGVTTEVCGNCGASGAPVRDRSVLPADWAQQTYPGSWTDVASYRALLEQVRPAVNVALLIGHNTLRRQVVGYENRPARPDELREMVQILEQALDEGGRGFSTGLVYPPGMHAAREELVALARVASRHSGMYTSHMRSEGNRLIEAIQETLAIGQAAGVSVEVSHLKVTGRDNWGKIDDALAELRAARAAGQAVAADRYPYTSGATDLDVVLPDWAAEGGREATLKRLRDPGSCARLLDDLAGSRPASDWDGVTIGSTVHPENHRFRGMLLPEAARVLGVSIPEAILHFGRTDNLCTGAFFAGMSGANMRRILVEPYVMIGSDASLRATEGPLSTDYPHPRAYGAFPRFLRMCLDEHFMPLAEAIRKMTALPASHFNLSGRGILAKGNRADIIVFNPSRFTDRATYGAPHQYAEGIEHVLVNGVLTLSEGHLTGLRAGVFID